MVASLELTLHPNARDELREVVAWYREKTGDASAFLAELGAVFDSVTRSPERWPVLRNVTPAVRYRVLPAHPYTVFYRLNATGVLVVAVAHQRRQPLYWSHRK